MRFADYLKNSLVDILLCVLASSSLCYACLIAFNSTSPFEGTPLVVVGSCAALVLALFLIAYSFRTAAIGSVLLAFALVGAVVACWGGSGAASVFDDVPGNGALFVILVAACSVLTFVLSRKKRTVLVLLVGGLLACSLMEYMYWEHQYLAVALFALGCGGLYAFHNYKQGLTGSDTERLAFGSATLAGVGVCVTALLLSGGIFAVAIAPQQPPSMTVKLLTRHVRLQEEQVKGVGDAVNVQNDRLFSYNTSGQTDGTGAGQGAQSKKQSRDTQKDEEQQQHVAGASYGLDNSGQDAARAVQVPNPVWLPVGAVLGVLACAALVIGVRKLLRKKRYRRLQSLPNRERAGGFYLMFTRAFEKMSFPGRSSLTPREYAISAADALERFEKEADCPTFASLTHSYERSNYGNGEPGDGEMDDYESYYRAFYRNARRYVGWFRYVPLFFRI